MEKVISILEIDARDCSRVRRRVQIDVHGQNVGDVDWSTRTSLLDAWQYLTNLVANKGGKRIEKSNIDGRLPSSAKGDIGKPG